MSIHAVPCWPFKMWPLPPWMLPTVQERYELYLRGAIRGFNSPAWPTLRGSKSLSGAYLANCLTAPPPAQEKPVYRLCCSEAWLSGWTSSRSPLPFTPLPPGRCCPTPCHTRSSPEGICILGRYWPLIGQVWAAGLRAPLPMAATLRDSQGEDKLLYDTSPFSAPNSSHCIVFSFFNPSSSSSSCSLVLFSHCEKEVWVPTGGPHLFG